ncbi:MAG TPA: hypothetical protein VE968_07950 [Sphingomicrobium sp.]|nr:hypothetical protein [Sphingomicrobium sp.]
MTEDELRHAQAKLDERVSALESSRGNDAGSSTKNWLPIVLPIAGTVAVAIITAGTSWVASHAQTQETERAQQAQHEETLRTQIAASQQQSVDNGRQAATMYFTNLADLRSKDKLSAGEKKRFARDLEIVAAISGNDDLKDIMTRAARDAAYSVRDERTQQSAAEGGATTLPSTAIQALPDLVAPKPAKAYAPTDFLAYPEVPASRWSTDVQGFRNTLSAIGFATQIAEKIRPELAPQKNEVRYYKPEHRAVATLAAAQLSKSLHQRFTAKLLGGGATLPNGVMEFWLGTNPDPA